VGQVIYVHCDLESDVLSLDGANLWAALRVAERMGPDKQVVTIAPDSGLKYLQCALYS
jgi:hypothetical protein